MDFRHLILEAARDCLYELEIHSSDAIPERPGFFYPVKYSGDIDKIRQPNAGYNTPLWQVVLRPITPQDISQNNLVPSCFLKVASGQRSARGGGLKNSPMSGAIGTISEDLEIWIQCIFRDGFGAAATSRSVAVAKDLSSQITGFILDLDKCLNVSTLRPSAGNDVSIVDAYVSAWQVMQALEGSPDEVVVAKLIVSVNYNRID